MSKILKNFIAICVGILPLNVLMIWYRLTNSEGFTMVDMLVYPLIFGGGNILLILALNKYLLKEKINDFNLGKGKWYWDILTGLSLTAVSLLLMYIEQATFSRFLPHGQPPPQEIINMMIDLANNPVLLTIWLGPVVWIGVALFEEITRTFFLNCLWRFSKNKAWELFAIILVSVFAGFMHFYQGPFGIMSIGIQGLVVGLFYYKFRRIWPLIISHALYDSIQIAGFVIQVS